MIVTCSLRIWLLTGEIVIVFSGELGLTKPPQKILIVATQRIGDVLLATPLIRSLRRAWPETKIDALVFAGTEGVLLSNPDIDQIITVEQRPSRAEHLRLLMRLWRNYDVALSLMASDRPSLYARIAGKRCIGLLTDEAKHWWKKWLLTQWLKFDDLDTHTVRMNLQLADALGVPRCHAVVAAWDAEDEQVTGKTLPFDIDTQTYAVLHVCPMYAYKAWHRGAWIELADWLRKQDIRVVLTGGNSAEERAYIDELLGLLAHDTVDVSGKLRLASVAYLLSKAHVYVGPDTVITHLAAATGTPTVALFGPSNPVKWGPWPKNFERDSNPYRMRGTQQVNNVVLVQGEGICVPCREEGCDRHNASLSDCLQQLSAASVIAALQALLNKRQAIPVYPHNQ